MILTVQFLHLSTCEMWKANQLWVRDFHFRITVSFAWGGLIIWSLYYETTLTLISYLLSLHRFIMKLFLLSVVLLLLAVEDSAADRILSRRTKRELASPLHVGGIRDPYGSYCQRRGGCCPGRDDLCTVPYLDTICYCDLFCNRTVSDCCPDFWGHCLGVQPPFIGKWEEQKLMFECVCVHWWALLEGVQSSHS